MKQKNVKSKLDMAARQFRRMNDEIAAQSSEEGELPTDCAALFALRDETQLSIAALQALLADIEQAILINCTA